MSPQWVNLITHTLVLTWWGLELLVLACVASPDGFFAFPLQDSLDETNQSDMVLDLEPRGRSHLLTDKDPLFGGIQGLCDTAGNALTQACTLGDVIVFLFSFSMYLKNTICLHAPVQYIVGLPSFCMVAMAACQQIQCIPVKGGYLSSDVFMSSHSVCLSLPALMRDIFIPRPPDLSPPLSPMTWPSSSKSKVGSALESRAMEASAGPVWKLSTRQTCTHTDVKWVRSDVTLFHVAESGQSLGQLGGAFT